MRQQRLRTASVLCVAFAIVLCVSPARAGWEQGIVQVHATNARVPQLATCSDGAGGAIVVWQEETSGGLGVLRSGHIRSDAALDPDWGDGVIVAGTETTRSRVFAIADSRGGAYIGWLEDAEIFLTHLEPSGGVSTGWPAGGRRLGALHHAAMLPRFIPDGEGGIYVGWQGGQGLTPGPGKVLVHLGSTGARAGGWRVVALEIPELATPEALPFGLCLAPAADGGLWLAWARATQDSLRVLTGGGEYRATHIRRDGTPAPGWGLAGREMGAWSVAPGLYFLVVSVRSSPLAIADAGDGGCYLLRYDFSPEEPVWSTTPRVLRYASNGKLRADWSTEGLAVTGTFSSFGRVEESPQMQALADGSIVSSTRFEGVESIRGMTIHVATPDRPTIRFQSVGGLNLDLRLQADGSALLTDVASIGGGGGLVHYPAFVSGALIAADGREARFVEEQQPNQGGPWYGATAIASLGPESALFVWSQELGRHGVFANRLVLGQPVLDAGAPPTQIPKQTLRAAFRRGEGVRVHATFDIASASRVQLFDLAGRQLAETSASNGRALELVVPDTADLDSGLYFVRATHGPQTHSARVIVAR